MGGRRNKIVPAEPLAVDVRCVKKRYATEAEANRARIVLYRVNERKKKQRGQLDVWLCPYCHGWHVGHHQNWWTQKARRERKQ